MPFQVKTTQQTVSKITQKNTESQNVISNLPKQDVINNTSKYILVYADPHFACTSSVLRKRGEVYSARLEELINTFKFINETASKYNADIYCLGDLFDRCNLNAEELTALKQCDLSNHTVILGNHETNGRDLFFNTVNAANVKTIIQRPTRIGKIGFVPYCPHTDLWDLEDVKGCDILLSHIDIKGITNGTYYSTIGYDAKKLSSCAKLIINGHLHTHNWIDNICNLGSIVGLNFSSTHENSRPQLAVINTDTLEINYYENPYSCLFYKKSFNNEQDIIEFLDSLPDRCVSCVSIKVPSNLLEYTSSLLNKEYSKKIYYSRVEPDYSFDNFEAVMDEDNKPQSKIEYMDGMESLKEFVTSVYDKESTNLKIMLEEIDAASV